MSDLLGQFRSSFFVHVIFIIFSCFCYCSLFFSFFFHFVHQFQQNRKNSFDYVHLFHSFFNLFLGGPHYFMFFYTNFSHLFGGPHLCSLFCSVYFHLCSCFFIVSWDLIFFCVCSFCGVLISSPFLFYFFWFHSCCSFIATTYATVIATISSLRRKTWVTIFTH